jgi:hypothetical protein
MAVRSVPLWPVLTSYPARWMILSCVMLGWWVAVGFLLGIHVLRESTPRCSSMLHLLRSGRYGLGPKPGTLSLYNRFRWFCFVVRIMRPDVRQCLVWSVEVIGLLFYVCFWYGANALDILHDPPLSYAPDKSEWSTPTSLTRTIDLPCATICNLLSLTSERVVGSAMNAHRTLNTFDPEFVLRLFSVVTDREDVFEIILDTGCTFAISPHREDFVDYVEGGLGSVNTVGGTTQVVGYGVVNWQIISESGEETVIRVPCHHVPASKVRLLSPQDYCAFHGFDRSRDHFGGNSSYFWLHLSHSKTRFQCPIDSRSNLPVALGRRPPPNDSASSPPGQCNCHSCNSLGFTVADETNQNLTPAQKELLSWHWKLGHLGFDHLQRLMRAPSDESLACIPTRFPTTSTCTPPKCTACEYAKAKRRHIDVSSSTTPRTNIVRKELLPGERVSIDQYESSARGRLSTSRGKTSFGQKLSGGTIYCDHASRYIECHHQVSLRALDTIRGKRLFERNARSCGVSISSYRGDNGIFSSKEFRDELLSLDQSITFSGVGAHHQNGVAERTIRLVVERARAMMQHAHLHWPAEFQLDLWPFAMHYACWLHNNIPDRDSGLSPIEIFCGTKKSCSELRRAHTFMCPSFILHPKLQDGRKIPKWERRSRAAQFLGFLPEHSSLIGVFRNLSTEAVSPQFHVVYDDLFSTVPSHISDDDEAMWVELFTSERDYYGHDTGEDNDDPILLLLTLLGFQPATIRLPRSRFQWKVSCLHLSK